MNVSSFFTGSKIGTAGGTLTILFLHIRNNDIVKTIVMAAIGATVSFVVSQVLKWVIKKLF
jgi:hypothetical protein